MNKPFTDRTIILIHGFGMLFLAILTAITTHRAMDRLNPILVHLKDTSMPGGRCVIVRQLILACLILVSCSLRTVSLYDQLPGSFKE